MSNKVMSFSTKSAEWFLQGTPRAGWSKRSGRNHSLLNDLGIKPEGGDYSALNGVVVTKEDKAAAKIVADNLEAHNKVDGYVADTSEWRMDGLELAAAHARVLNSVPWPKGCGTSLTGLKRKTFMGHAKLAKHLNGLFPGVNFGAPENMGTPIQTQGMSAAAMQTATPPTTQQPAQIVQVVEEPDYGLKIAEVHEWLASGYISEEQCKEQVAALLAKHLG